MNTNIKHLSVPGFFLILFFASVSTLYSANVSVEVQENIDVLIMGMRDSTPHQFCQDIFKNFPDLLIVGLVDDGRMAVACLTDVSSRQLVDIITLLGVREGLTDG